MHSKRARQKKDTLTSFGYGPLRTEAAWAEMHTCSHAHACMHCMVHASAAARFDDGAGAWAGDAAACTDWHWSRCFVGVAQSHVLLGVQKAGTTSLHAYMSKLAWIEQAEKKVCFVFVWIVVVI